MLVTYLIFLSSIIILLILARPRPSRYQRFTTKSYNSRSRREIRSF